MTTGPLFANFIAGGTIRPARVCKNSLAAPHTCLEQTAANLMPVGVSARSTKAHDNANHAETGDQVTLQDGRFVMEIEAGAAIAVGVDLFSDTQGRATSTGAVNDIKIGCALEAAGGAGEIIEMFWQPYPRTV